MVFSVMYDYEEDKIKQPIIVKGVEEKAKLVSVGLAHSFVVTESNKVFAWKQSE